MLVETINQKELLRKEIKHLKEMTPEPMNTMLVKQPKDEAIKKRNERKAIWWLKMYPPQQVRF